MSLSSIMRMPVTETDHAEWHNLWEAYLDFYHTKLPESQFEDTFARLVKSTKDEKDNHDKHTPNNICGLILRDEAGVAQGLAHYLFHVNCWTPKHHCYLNDLYVKPGCRGKGYGKALIRAVEEQSKTHGSIRLYWTTAPDNVTARKLYDSVATTDRVAYRINH